MSVLEGGWGRVDDELTSSLMAVMGAPRLVGWRVGAGETGRCEML